MSEELVPVETTVVEVVPTRREKVVESIKRNVTAENIQKYVLGTKKNGAPRAVYDIIKDFTKPGKKKKKHKKKKKAQHSMYDIYCVGKKKKKHKKKKKSKYWHI